MKPCPRCLPTQTDDVPLYSEEDLHIHELVGHYKCELCSQFFSDNPSRGQHLAEVHGKMYLSKEKPTWPDGVAELVDIPGWQKRFEKPNSTPPVSSDREKWLGQFAMMMVEAAAKGEADRLLQNPPSELREQAQYVNWIQATHPKSAHAWKRARYRNRERSKEAKATFLAKAWANAESAAPTYLKKKGF